MFSMRWWRGSLLAIISFQNHEGCVLAEGACYLLDIHWRKMEKYLLKTTLVQQQQKTKVKIKSNYILALRHNFSS